MLDEGLGAHDPAQAEARHRMRFGEARHHHAALRHAGQAARAQMRPGEGEILIDLVGEQPEIVAPGERCDGLDLRAGEDGAGRVVRAVEPQHARPRRHPPRQRREIGMEAGLGQQRHGHQRRAGGAGHGLISGIGRLEGDDLVAGPGDAVQCSIESGLGSRHDRHILGGGCRAGAALYPGGDGGAQRGQADDRRIAGFVALQRGHGGRDHRLGRALVGIADGQQQHVAAFGALALGVEMHAPGPGAAAGDAADQWRELHQGLSSAGMR